MCFISKTGGERSPGSRTESVTQFAVGGVVVGGVCVLFVGGVGCWIVDVGVVGVVVVIVVVGVGVVGAVVSVV